jgi:hypothetical protein
MTSMGVVSVHGQKVFALANLPLCWAHAGAVSVMNDAASDLNAFDAQLAPGGGDARRDDFESGDCALIREHLKTVLPETLRRAYAAVLPGFAAPHTSFLVSVWANSTPLLLSINQDGSVTVCPTFAAIGSGGGAATIAHALVEHLLDGGHVPVELGLRLAYRTIETTYNVMSQGVGPPVQLSVVDDAGARLLPDPERDQIGDAVTGWKLIERDTFLDLLKGPAAAGAGHDEINLSDVPDMAPENK